MSDRSAGELLADGTWGFQAGGLAAVVEPAVRALVHIVATNWLSAGPFGNKSNPSPAYSAGLAGVDSGGFLQRFVPFEPGPLDRHSGARTASPYDVQREVTLNEGLWWLLHNMTDFFPRLDDRDFAGKWQASWNHYRGVAKSFGNALRQLTTGAVDPSSGEHLPPAVAPDATLIVHDFHLALLGEELPAGMKSVYVCHTPFGRPESFEKLPAANRMEFLRALQHFDAIVFHTEKWQSYFLTTLEANGLEAPRTVVVPAHIDPQAVIARAGEDDVVAARHGLRQRLRDSGATEQTKVVSFVARVDLKNGNVSSLESLRQWMIAHPERAHEVRMVMCCKATRDYGHYRDYQREVHSQLLALQETADAIAAERGIPSWEPVILDDTGDRAVALAAMCEADVFWANAEAGGLEVTPAEAALLMKPGGRLMISEGAGIHELYRSFQGRPAAIMVPSVPTYPRPHQVEKVVERLDEALNMEPERAMAYWSTAREVALFNDPRVYSEALRQAVDDTLHLTPLESSTALLSRDL